MTKAEMLKLYWDTSVWVAWNHDRFNLRSLCTRILKEAEAGNLKIVMSTLVIAEFGIQDQQAKELFDRYLDRSLFVLVNVTKNIAVQARSLVERIPRLKGSDAVHIATALYAKNNVIYTTDNQLLGLADQVPEIRICWPEWPFPQVTFDFNGTGSTIE